ncbi:hypothetical protein [Aquibacillus albus]|uniref:Uncharacterized protein n=1 Tax=Aquibacillus albus TaxID=1168171 RepID=A0ABS2N2C9_9BACI|nr:hypothetical protein [Aquibacillus albus]MBM7572070.1 hypothetical protein [Aquibacillus albus]
MIRKNSTLVIGREECRVFLKSIIVEVIIEVIHFILDLHLQFSIKRCTLKYGNHPLGNANLRRLLGEWGLIFLGGEKDGNYTRA